MAKHTRDGSMPALLASAILLLSAWVERTDWVQVAPATHLRVLTRTHDDALPALVYQPFAGSWPQIHAGDRVFLPLADSFTLVTFDPRGVGRSSGTFNASARAEDLAAVCVHAAARSSRVYVVSISSATIDTLLLAAAPPRPLADGVLGGVLLASPTPPDWDTVWEHWAPAIRRVWGVSPQTLARLPRVVQATLMLVRTPYHRCRDSLWCSGEVYNPWTYAGSPHYPHPFRTYVQASAAMLACVAPTDAALPTHLQVPAHFWWGAHDPPAAWSEAYARRVHAARVTVVPDAAHAAHLEDSESFRAAVRALLPGAARGVAPPAPPPAAPATPKLPFAAQFVVGACILATALLAVRLAPWVARKLVHVGIGVLLVFAELDDWRVRYAVYVVTALTLTLTATNGARTVMRFSHKDVRVDPGIVFYVCTCSVACFFRIEFLHLLPLFLADPMGAIVGRNVRTPKLYGSKSVGGTAAVWITALLTLPEADVGNRAAGATVVALLELFGGEFDNVCIGAFLLARAAGHA